MSVPYSPHYAPPAPVVEVVLGIPGETPAVGPLTALVDTGADMSVASKAVLHEMAAPSLFEAHLRSPWGELIQL